ncbi:MAG: L-serine ammonia-lyase [Cyclobacteriaceae bacterium]|nr:L-serine ammonia-lyase [Cyclobacteriaceae bacterium]
MERISIFDILKIGIGPSSSHTLGPWRAMQQCLSEFNQKNPLQRIQVIRINLYGSLAKTGIGHGTDKAIMLAVSGFEPETIDCSQIDQYINEIKEAKLIRVSGRYTVPFDPSTDIIFDRQIQLPFHSNALRVTLTYAIDSVYEDVFYSIGGGFVVKGPSEKHQKSITLPFPIDSASDLLHWCNLQSGNISDIVFKNEKAWRSEEQIYSQLQKIIETMKESVFRGCHSTGILPGGLRVKRRASFQNEKLIETKSYHGLEEWLNLIKLSDRSFRETLNWVNCFALAVNEENAAFGRVVTAPTNGAAGVIPAVMLYYLCFCDEAEESDLYRFLLVAGELGSIFKKGSTISAAMGGCMAEIGVSAAMAAGALTELLGGSPEKVLMAAEIAMEHHLGLTCDPVGGLVQVPCIERNAMGAMKAITASQIALASEPQFAKVSLDDVIKTMWHTAGDMNSKYKETAEGGLAVQIPVSMADC